MHNCMIMGSGRSGTSMVAGLLSNAGYYMGDNLIPPRAANPKGFFESPYINLKINEAALNKVKPVRRGHWWLTPLGFDTVVSSDPEIRRKIRTLVDKVPYCFKDPRFCYTLPIWRPFLRNTRFICVFRHPASTVSSIMKECRLAPYLAKINMSREKAYTTWMIMYRHIMKRHMRKGMWLFVHYNQMFTNEGFTNLSKFLKVSVALGFPEKAIRKKTPKFAVPNDVQTMYSDLCDLADYNKDGDQYV